MSAGRGLLLSAGNPTGFNKSQGAAAMFPTNAYRMYLATADDADAPMWLADHGSGQALVGRVLIGEIHGTPAAALSLVDGRLMTDGSRTADRLVAALRMRASAIRAYEATPSLPERLRTALATYHAGSNVVAAPVWSRDGDAEDERERLAA
jgi:hypothetical protein